MNHDFNPMECPAPDRIPSEQLPVRGADFVAMVSQIVSHITDSVNERERLENKAQRIQLTGKLVWIVNRFVDIDFEGLKTIPGIKDDDHLMVLQDETHDGQCSIYRIYNTASIPNVRYLGYGEPDKYPTVPAVEQFVNYSISKRFADLANLEKVVDQLNTKVQQLTDDLVAYRTRLDSIDQGLNSIDQELNNIEQTQTEHTSNFSRVNTDMLALKQKLPDQEEKIQQIKADIEMLKEHLPSTPDVTE